MKTKSVCDRCFIPSIVLSGSYFNTQMCCPRCLDIEKKHPEYKNAVTVELAAIKKGDFNFQGIGLPKGYDEWVKNL